MGLRGFVSLPEITHSLWLIAKTGINAPILQNLCASSLMILEVRNPKSVSVSLGRPYGNGLMGPDALIRVFININTP